MKSYENKPDEQLSSAGLSSAEETQHDSGGDEAIITTDTVSANSDNSVEQTTHDDIYEEEMLSDPSGNRGFWPPSREQVLTAVAFGSVLLLAAILRFVGLGEKPLHHDESLHAYFSMQVLRNNIQNWWGCLSAAPGACYRYDPLTHGPFQFHITAFIYGISQIFGVSEHGVNTTTARIAAATLGTILVGLPYFIRDYLGKVGAWLACFLLAISPSLVYYSRFTREDIYMACFTLMMVVAIARYVRDRKAGWLILAAIAFILSYATKEATYLTIAIFGSFLIALVIWELTRGAREEQQDTLDVTNPSSPLKRFFARYRPHISVLAFFAVLGVIALWFFNWVKNASIYLLASTANKKAADVLVGQLKTYTQVIMPWLGILLAVVVIVIMMREHAGALTGERRGWAKSINPRRQPLLDTIATMPWTHWFFAVVTGWFIYLVLYTALFTNIQTGIGDGVWQGLYYWLEQHHVARGGQPIYYYLLLIPLYEQIGLVFGLVGLVRCLLRPNTFRLFLAYWFLGNLVIYSWAGEKMPWLMIHITLPMMLLAAVGLEPAVSKIVALVRNWKNRQTTTVDSGSIEVSQPPYQTKQGKLALGGAIATVALAVLTLLPTLQNMFQVSFVHPADAPHEMMIYVQTSTDINTVMKKIEQIDKQKYGGQYQVRIGITADATWPFAWYMRDYKNVCFQYPNASCTTDRDVIVAAIDQLGAVQVTHENTFKFHQYKMRVQWDQGYMPKPCEKKGPNDCKEAQPYTGVGPWRWLSYGPNPPPNAPEFDPVRAATNIWQWWWYRKAFGSVDGSYDMGLFINNKIIEETGVQP